MVHALKGGGRQGDCPEHVYGLKNTLYNWFRRSAERDVCWRIITDLAEIDGDACQHGIGSIASRSTALPATQKAVLAHFVVTAKDRRKTKHYTFFDEKGRTLLILQRPGKTNDAKVAMLASHAMPPSQYLIAGKGYDSSALRSWLIVRGTMPVIPSKSNRMVEIEHDRLIYCQRNVVDHMVWGFKN